VYEDSHELIYEDYGEDAPKAVAWVGLICRLSLLLLIDLLQLTGNRIRKREETVEYHR
jgi:hypothetical protein